MQLKRGSKLHPAELFKALYIRKQRGNTINYDVHKYSSVLIFYDYALERPKTNGIRPM